MSYDNASVITSSPQNFNKWIISHPKWITKEYNNITWNKFIKRGAKNNVNALILCDPIEKDTYFPLNPEYNSIQIPSGYFIGISDPNKKKNIDVVYNFENKTIGYFNSSEYYFIQAIIQSYRMNVSTIRLKQLSNSSAKNLLSAIKLNTIDILITYVIIDSDLFNYIQKQRISVLGFDNLDFSRVKLFYPYIIPNDIKLSSIFTYNKASLLLIPQSDDVTILPKMTMKLVNKSSNIKETFITRLKLDPESLEAGYRCYGNPYTESKAECESPNDIYGKPIQQIKWDKECQKNEDCPFYKKNKNYENSRGGCLENGLCEMPIGVLQASPRKYFDSGRFPPFCYGCGRGVDNRDCCEITKDYAFVNDTEARQKAGLKTSISLM